MPRWSSWWGGLVALLAVLATAEHACAQGRMPTPPANLRINPATLPATAPWANFNDADRADPLNPGSTLSSDKVALRAKVRKTLAYYYQRHLNTREHNPWEIMHAVIGFGLHCTVLRDGPNGPPVSGIGWLCYNGPCKGDRMLVLDKGRVTARKGHYVQGHYGQFLAILAQSRLSDEYPVRVDGKEFTIRDLVETEKLTCESGIELTFKLISLMHYLDSEATWTSDAGQEWSIRRLIREEISAPVRGAACGGTHRLMALAYAVQKRKQRGEPIDGEFLQAQQYLDQYHRYTFSLQNPDGSFSTEWFVRKGDRADLDRRLQTTGHILEWLVFSLPENQLDNPRIVKAVNYLCTLLLSEPRKDWEIGTLHHGLHALALYNERRFSSRPSSTPVQVAERPTRSALPTEEESMNPPGTVAEVPTVEPEASETSPPPTTVATPSPYPTTTPASAAPNSAAGEPLDTAPIIPPLDDDDWLDSVSERSLRKPKVSPLPAADDAASSPPMDAGRRNSEPVQPFPTTGESSEPKREPPQQTGSLQPLFAPPPLAPVTRPAVVPGGLELNPLGRDYNLLLGPNDHLVEPDELPDFDEGGSTKKPPMAEPAPEPAVGSTAVQAPAVEPHVAAPPAVEPAGAKPQAVNPQTVEPQTVAPQAVNPQTVKPQAETPQAAKPQVVEAPAERTAAKPNPPATAAPSPTAGQWRRATRTPPKPIRTESASESSAPKQP